ncbi:GtrA family protein [Sphingobacterium endophyticum]|uniref:GtrA family protein n=1 Tax=Sphingobacterium endophyticum TaxID=2546448 RepID=UPI0018CD423D|nr:GtrA family protein [Sphingobacterium endophyticum]
MVEIVFRAFKFALVGFFGMGIDFLFTWIFKEKLHINKFIANSIGFIIAVFNNYLLNRIWTFSSQNPQIFKQFISFLGISAIGLGLNTLFLYFFHEKLNLNFYLSKFLAIGMVFIWNFSANLIFTFKNG